MTFLGLSAEDRNNLKFEVIPQQVRLQLTRLIRHASTNESLEAQIMLQNIAINIGRAVLGKPRYILEPDDMGSYQQVEYAWHYGEIEILMQRPNTIQLVETIADLIQNNALSEDDVNKILSDAQLSFGFYVDENMYGRSVNVDVCAIEEIEKEVDMDEHPNIRILVHRMENAINGNDPTATLHTSATIFETLAKIIINAESIDNQTLGSFFEKYRKESRLPKPVLDYILDIYNMRSAEPLAAHGSRKTPKITIEQAIVLSEMTKAFLRIERQLANINISEKKDN